MLLGWKVVGEKEVGKAFIKTNVLGGPLRILGRADS